MSRSFRPFIRVLTTASLLAAGVTSVALMSEFRATPALAAPNTDCTVTEPPTVNGVVQVTTPGHLKWIATNTVSLSATIEQQNDLDLTACGNWPGIGMTVQNPFTGHYHGGGRAIIGLSYNDSSGRYKGLFGATLNATLSSINVVGTVIGDQQMGGLVGQATGGVITDSSAAVTVSANTASNKWSTGGLAGETLGTTITNSSATGDITGNSGVGGLVGYAENTIITNSYATGAVNGTGGSVGGLVGYNDITSPTLGSIESSWANGTVTASGDSAGGLVGDNFGPITDSHATAHVTGASYVGGLIGYHRNAFGRGDITASSAAGNVTATGNNAGGLVGYVRSQANLHTTISASTASGDVTGSTRVGGLIGYALVEFNHNGPITVSNVSASGHVTSTGSGSAGGLIGRASNYYTMSIGDASATGDVTSAGDNAGGLIGWLYDERSGSVTTVERAYATGDVSAPASWSVGGLIGNVYHFSSGSRTTITQTHAHGDVSGFEWVGGLIGDLSTRGATVSASFAMGDVSASQQYAGGLIGWVGRLNGVLIGRDLYAQGNASGNRWNAALIGGFYNYNNVDLDNAYASGTASGNTEIGGAVAGQFTEPDTGAGHTWTVDHVFYATDPAYTRVAYGTAKTRAELDQFATYSNAGWSITDGGSGSTVWGRCDGVTYPFLMWQTQLPAGTPGRVVCPTPEVVLPPAIGQLITQPVATSTTTVAPSTTTTTPSTTTAPANTTPAPVFIDGALPELPAGDVTVVEDGQPVTVETSTDGNTLVLQAATFELRLEGNCSTGGCTLDTTPQGRAVLTLEQNGAAATTGLGFQPGSRVDIWLFSEPRYLGELTVNADGTFQGNVQLGDIDPGEHTLQVNGTSQTGAQRSANLGVVVNPQALPTPGAGQLPETGSSTTPLALLASALLGLGVVTVTTRRRA